MAQNIFPTPTGDDWTLISSVTPTAGASTVSFTSISGYKKLLLRSVNVALGTSGNLTFTLNSDTGTNYTYSSISIAGSALSTTLMSFAASNIPLGTGTTAGNGLMLFMNDTNTLNLKTFNGYLYPLAVTTPAVYPSITGAYFASASISTVTLTASTTFTATGTVALYGVKI